MVVRSTFFHAQKILLDCHKKKCCFVAPFLCCCMGRTSAYDMPVFKSPLRPQGGGGGVDVEGMHALISYPAKPIDAKYL